MRREGRTKAQPGHGVRLAAALALGLIGMVAPPAAAAPARVELVRSISPPNPFPGGCGTPSRIRHTESEPSLAVNPRDPNNLIAAWMQDSRQTGGAVDVAGAFSRDGGRSWSGVTFPRTTRCTGSPHYDRNADVWLSFGPDGKAYFASLPGQPGEVPQDPLGPLAINTRLLVHRSTNGGASWSNPVFVPPAVVEQDRFQDKEIITADPRRPGHAYLVWIHVDDPLFATYFSRTADGGRTWSPARLVRPSDPLGFDPPTQLLVLPDGTLLYVFSRQPFLGGPAPIRAMRSQDRGETWSAPVQVSDENASYYTHDPDTGERKEDRAMQGTAAVAPDGTIYAVWQDVPSRNESRIEFSRSVDGGRSWSRASAIANVRGQAFRPTPSVMRDGTVGVIYHDDRRDRPGDAVWTTDVWFAHSHDRGRSWREIHLAGPSNYRQPRGLGQPEDRRAFSVREYEGMVALPTGFGAAFFQGRGAARQGLSDIFFARVRLAGRPADGNGGAGGGTSGNATTNSNVNRNAQSSHGGLRGRP